MLVTGPSPPRLHTLAGSSTPMGPLVKLLGAVIALPPVWLASHNHTRSAHFVDVALVYGCAPFLAASADNPNLNDAIPIGVAKVCTQLCHIFPSKAVPE